MRLQELYHIFLKKQGAFHAVAAHPIRTESDGGAQRDLDEKIHFINAYPFYMCLSSLEELPGFEGTASKFLEIIGDQRVRKHSEDCIITTAQALAVNSYIDGIIFSMRLLSEFFDKAGIHEREYGFDIKLPPNISLQHLTVLVKNLDLVFSQCPLFSKDDGQITYSGVDVGSSWLTFAVVGAGATYILSKLAEFVDKCIIIRSHWLTCKQQEETARKLGLSNDILNSMKKSSQAILEKVEENILNELASSNDITNPEDKERLKYSMNLFTEQMSKGMEIYASVESPKEIKATFPPIETQALPDTILKMLTENASSESDTD